VDPDQRDSVVSSWAPATQLLNLGYDPELSEGSVKCPLFQTSTFSFRTAQQGKQFFEIAYGLRERRPDESVGLIYSRINNPNLEILEQRLCMHDGAERSAVFSSGMAAISTAILTFVKPGDVIAYSDPLYGGSDHLMTKVLPEFGIRTVAFPANAAMDEIAVVLKEANQTGHLRMVLVESPANPTNALIDLHGLASILDGLASANGRPRLAVDNTLLGPVWQQPLAHGADLVVYSLTKYVGGHSDVIAGACLGRAADIAQVAALRTFLGSMLDPHSAWLLMRSLETLEIRMQRAASNAATVADFLRTHPKVLEVLYLGHLDPSSSAGRLYARQCSGAGSTFSILLQGGEPQAFQFLDALRVVRLAVSLGGTESLASHPASMTHADVDVKRKQAYGIGDNLVRLSIGIEDPRDLVADVRQALECVRL
jgi:methionine-gamma-lyase